MLASILPNDIGDISAAANISPSSAVNEPSLSQPEEAAEVFNPIDSMDTDEEVRQNKNDDESPKNVAAEKESKAKKTKKTVLITGAILLAAAIALGVGFGVSNSAPAPSPAPTPAPTLDPQREWKNTTDRFKSYHP